MLGTLILGIAAGALAPHAEPKVKIALENILLDDVPAEPIEMRLFAFAVCLVLAAILSMIFAEPHAAPLAVGAAIGIFGPRLMAKWNASKNPDYDS
ncbi:MAG: hypothetical protein KJO30_02230 [Boseongicola sp.]|nr:hypothetical protein [Boseongicola sp.]NNJ69624.1 hypothetical protein [Boseongicola sp.]